MRAVIESGDRGEGWELAVRGGVGIGMKGEALEGGTAALTGRWALIGRREGAAGEPRPSSSRSQSRKAQSTNPRGSVRLKLRRYCSLSGVITLPRAPVGKERETRDDGSFLN